MKGNLTIFQVLHQTPYLLGLNSKSRSHTTHATPKNVPTKIRIDQRNTPRNVNDIISINTFLIRLKTLYHFLSTGTGRYGLALPLVSLSL
jgi:hypothetical protein